MPPAILALATSATRVVVADKRYGRSQEAQDEIYQAVLGALADGHRVVRIHCQSPACVPFRLPSTPPSLGPL